MNASHQYLKGSTGLQEKISRNGSRSNGLRRKNGVNIIDDFLQKAIDARDIELLTASIVVAKDIITNDGSEKNEPNQASPSRISLRQRKLLSGDAEAMNLIVRAEGYLSLLTKQKLSHEAVEAVCRRSGVSRDENENGNGGQQVDSFVESFYNTYQSSLMHPGGSSSINASQDSRDETSPDARGLHPGVTPAPGNTSSSSSSFNASNMGPSSSTTPVSSAVSVPTPSTTASLEVISDAGHFVAGAFSHMLYGMGSIIPYIGPDQDATNTTDERGLTNTSIDPIKTNSNSNNSSSSSLVSPMMTAIAATPSTSTNTTVDSVPSRDSTAIAPELPSTAQALPPADAGLASTAPSTQPPTHPSTGPPSRPLSLSYMVGASHMTHPNACTNNNGSGGYNLAGDFDLSDVLTPPSCKQLQSKPLMPSSSSSSQSVVNDFTSNDIDHLDNVSSGGGPGAVDVPPRLGLHPVKHRPLPYNPAQTQSRVRVRGPHDTEFSEVAELAVSLAATVPQSYSSSSMRPSVVARQVALSSMPASARIPNTASSSSSSRYSSHYDPRSTDVPVRSPRVSFAETQLNNHSNRHRHNNGNNDSAGDSSRYGTISPSSLGLLTPNPYNPTTTTSTTPSSSSADASGQGQGQGHVGHAFAAFASFMASLGLPLMPPQHSAPPSSSMMSPRGSSGRPNPSTTMIASTPQRHRHHHPNPSSRLPSDCTPSQEVSDFLRRKSALSSSHYHHRSSASSGSSVISVSSSGSARRTWRPSDPNPPSSNTKSHRSDVPSPAASEFLRRKHAQMKAKAAALTPPRPPGSGMPRADPRVATVRGVSSVTDVAALFPSLATLGPSTNTNNSNSKKDKDRDPRQQQSSSSKTKATRTTPEEKEERRLAMAVRLAASNGSVLSPTHQSGGRVYSLLMSPERRQRARQPGVDHRHANDSLGDHRTRPLVPTWMTVGSAAGSVVSSSASSSVYEDSHGENEDCRSDVVDGKGGRAPSLCLSAISSAHSSTHRHRRRAPTATASSSTATPSAVAFSWLPWTTNTVIDTPSTPQVPISTHGASVAARAARFGAVVQFKPKASSSSSMVPSSSSRLDEGAAPTSSSSSSSSSSSVPAKNHSQRHRSHAHTTIRPPSSSSSVASGDSMTSGHSHSTRRSGFSSHGHGGSVVSVTSHHRMPISMTVLPKHRQGPGHHHNSSSGSSHQGQVQGPAATAKHLAAASAARALARQQQQASRSGTTDTGGRKATMSVFGSFLKFANFDDFFSSLQDDNNSHYQDGVGVGERSGPVAVSSSDGVYLLSGCELPEQDLLEDTDYDLRGNDAECIDALGLTNPCSMVPDMLPSDDPCLRRVQARTSTSSLGEPQQHVNTPLRAVEADQDQEVSPMSHATAIPPHSTNNHKHTALAEPPSKHLTVVIAAAHNVNPFPALDAMRDSGSASPCPPDDVIPSPRRGGDEIPPPGACAIPRDDHDVSHGHDYGKDDDRDAANGDRAHDNNRLHEEEGEEDSTAHYEVGSSVCDRSECDSNGSFAYHPTSYNSSGARARLESRLSGKDITSVYSSAGGIDDCDSLAGAPSVAPSVSCAGSSAIGSVVDYSPYRGHANSNGSVISDINSSASSTIAPNRHGRSRSHYPHPHHHRLQSTGPQSTHEEGGEEQENVSFGTMRPPSHDSSKQGVVTVVPLSELQDKGSSRQRREPGVHGRARREEDVHSEEEGNNVMSTAVTAFLRFLPVFE